MFFPKSEFKERVEKVRKALSKENLDAFLAGNDENVRYLSGVDTGRVLITSDEAIHWLAPVYSDMTAGVLEERERKKDAIKDFLKEKKFKAVGTDDLPYSAYKELKPPLKKLLKPVELLEGLRKIKSKKELEALEKSADIAKKGMAVATGQDITGMTEQQLTADIEYEIRKSGSESAPFGKGLLCLSGPNARHPHAFETDRVIKDGDCVVVDLGAVFEGYFSDMTHTIRVGNVASEKADLCDFIDDLKERAISQIKLGKKISELHNFCEEEIKKKGYEFLHLAGHGVGLQIHEAPHVSPDEEDVVQGGMAFTIEPGIYTTKFGGFGCRSEDTIIFEKKAKIITQ